jgi:hypothetical protein
MAVLGKCLVIYRCTLFNTLSVTDLGPSLLSVYIHYRSRLHSLVIHSKAQLLIALRISCIIVLRSSLSIGSSHSCIIVLRSSHTCIIGLRLQCNATTNTCIICVEASGNRKKSQLILGLHASSPGFIHASHAL